VNADQSARAGSDSLIEEAKSLAFPAKRENKVPTINPQARMDFESGGFVKHVETDDAGVAPDGVEDQAVAGA
jgi:hypothetical protein